MVKLNVRAELGNQLIEGFPDLSQDDIEHKVDLMTTITNPMFEAFSLLGEEGKEKAMSKAIKTSVSATAGSASRGQAGQVPVLTTAGRKQVLDAISDAFQNNVEYKNVKGKKK